MYTEGQQLLLTACNSVCNILSIQILHEQEVIFNGSDFVDWLLEKGLVRTREDAAQYGHSQLLGSILTSQRALFLW